MLALTVMGAIFALALLSGMPGAAQDDTPILAPENPAFIEFFKDPFVLLQQEAESGLANGIVPDPIDFSYLKDLVGGGGIVVQGVLPSSYDLRGLGRLTPIRNQGGCGSCWSFATYGSLESNLMPGESLNLSENNLKNRHGFDLSCCSGGNRAMSTAYLARWEGALSEAQDPYNASSCVSPSGLAPVKHVQEVIYIPQRSGYLDNDALKQAVMQYGAVYTAYYHSDSYYNSSTGAYYFNGSSQANHGVCIVGWDDNYDRSRFRTAPPGNGAFIIRNSWGTSWGLSGYFYISYYDTRLASENGAFIGEPATNYDAVYQYDPLGWVSSMGYGSNTAWFANVFTATTSSNVVAAGFYTPAPNASYELRVYVNPTSGPINSSGPASTTLGTIPAVGYHTVKLNTPVPITAGQKFSVVVKLTTPGYGSPVALERPYSGFTSKATASTGQSYVSSSGTSWTDVAAQYANTNVCLKAFTKGAAGPAPGALSVTPATGLSSSGPSGGPFTPSSQVFTLSNTGGQSINWTAGKTQSWVTLSSTGGALAAGATTTVTASINSGANSLGAGSYSDTVTFTNTTGGQSTTRSVALSVLGPGSLSVSPSTGLSSSGEAGGPFSPSSQQYTLANTGGQSINWSAGVTQPWVTLSLTGGTLAAGATTTVTISINSNANGLAAGSYSDVVTFVNTTNGSGNTTRSVSLNITQPVPVTGYQVGPALFNWIDPSSHTAISLSDNSVSTARALPFPFWFYGNTYNAIYIGSNGLMGFNSTGLTSYTNRDLPYPYTPNAAIYPYWDNLYPVTGTSVRMGVVGSTPNRKVVVSWANIANRYSTAVRYTFQAILCEGSNDIVFQYLTTSSSNLSYGGGAGATIGIENATGNDACQYSYNTRSVSDGQALLFTYHGLGPVPAALSLTPASSLSSSGPEGGPFSPSSQAYTLTNSGGEPLDWTASVTEPWVSLSPTIGILAAGASTSVTVSINSAANSLDAGSYSDTVRFNNATNGSGDTTRDVSLTVSGPAPPGALSVSPASGLASSGTVGGPFTPSGQVFTLSNTGGQTINWSASAAQPWVTLSSTGGTLAPGATSVVTASINSAANSLSAGTYTDSIAFVNTTNGGGTTTRPVSLTVSEPPPATGYKVVPTTFSWIDPSSHTTLTLSSNSVNSTQTIPFAFSLYGTACSRVHIGSNGLIGFGGTTGLYTGYNTNLPTSGSPNCAVYPYWDQLTMASGQVKVGTVGSAPNRRMVISWVNVAHYYSSSTKLTFQVVLCEGSNDIIVQYLASGSANYAYGGGSSATIGIENADGTEGCLYSYNTRSVFDRTALLFTASPIVQSRYRMPWPLR